MGQRARFIRASLAVSSAAVFIAACSEDTTDNQAGSPDASLPASGGSSGAGGASSGAGASGAPAQGGSSAKGGAGAGAGSASGATGNGGTSGATGNGGNGPGAGGVGNVGGAGGVGNVGGVGGSGADAAPPPVCDSTCHFVRQGATGSGDGSDWTNAFTDLPATLVRGDTYYVADGTYAKYTFDDAVSGTANVTVLKATASRHGTDTGWQSGYGDGSATFGPLQVRTDYTVIDGQAASGFIVAGEFQGSAVSIGADHVTLANTEIDGKFVADSGGQHTGGSCTGLDIGGASNVTVQGVHVHDVADDGVSISDSSSVLFTQNTVHALHACGTDGGCGPCYNGHSDGIEAYHVADSEFSRNFIYDVRSTSTFFFGNWADSLGNGPADYCKNLLLVNNVFYAPEVGLVAYIQDVDGVDVFNNVFWGIHQGSYGGLSVGLHVTKLRLYNNVILSINMAHVGATFDPAEHHGDYNLFGIDVGQWTNSANDRVVADPGFVGISGLDGPAVTNPQVTDFMLKSTSACIDKGTPGDASLTIPTTDFTGQPRSGTPDIGAYEHR